MEDHIRKNLQLATEVVAQLKKRGLHIATVESCTGGGLAYYITNIEGASETLEDSFVTYSNEAKIALGVNQQIIKDYNVYSLETAAAMAETAIQESFKADVGVGITGSISRKDPNNEKSQPGVAYIAVKYAEKTLTQLVNFESRERIAAKQYIIEAALRLILQVLDT